MGLRFLVVFAFLFGSLPADIAGESLRVYFFAAVALGFTSFAAFASFAPFASFVDVAGAPNIRPITGEPLVVTAARPLGFTGRVTDRPRRRVSLGRLTM
jgi:hypothetical protein